MADSVDAGQGTLGTDCHFPSKPSKSQSKCPNRTGTTPIRLMMFIILDESFDSHRIPFSPPSPGSGSISAAFSTIVITLPPRPNRPTRPARCVYVSPFLLPPDAPSGIPSMKTCVNSGRSNPRVVAGVQTRSVGMSDTVLASPRRRCARPLSSAKRSRPWAFTPRLRRSYRARETDAEEGMTSRAIDGTSSAKAVAMASNAFWLNGEGVLEYSGKIDK